MGSREKTVSSFLVETVNSDAKSSSIMIPPLVFAHRIYSLFFDALAVIPLGKLRNGVICRTDAFVRFSSDVKIPSLPSSSGSHFAPFAAYTDEIFSYDGFSIAYILPRSKN